MEWIVSEDVPATEEAAAQFIAGRLAQALSSRGRASLAISGGRSPWGMFEKLAREALPWNAVHLFQVDERIAPPNDEARNWKQVLANPLAQRIAPAHLHPMPVEHADAQLAAAQYAATLCEWTGEPPVLDVVHLGIGDDGHTASLFAGDPLLEDSEREVGVSGRHGGHIRLSLTLPALCRARSIVWFAVGAARRPALSRLFAHDTAIPASRVRRDDAVCFVDREAAPAI